LAALATAATPALAQTGATAPPPPPPSPSLPPFPGPGAVLEPAPAPGSAAATTTASPLPAAEERPAARPKKAKEAGKPSFTLGDDDNHISDDELDGFAESKGEITVKASGGTMTANLAGSTVAYGYVFRDSNGRAALHLVQRFTLDSGDSDDPRVAL